MSRRRTVIVVSAVLWAALLLWTADREEML